MDDNDRMAGFDFLIGEWVLDYRIPESRFSPAGSGTGIGRFHRVLNDQYVVFDYSCSNTTGNAAAHAIFGWDQKAKLYRFWWFEDSGAFSTATCDFLGDGLLFLNWHDSVLQQTFKKIGTDKIELIMGHPDLAGHHSPVLEVILTRK